MSTCFDPAVTTNISWITSVNVLATRKCKKGEIPSTYCRISPLIFFWVFQIISSHNYESGKYTFQTTKDLGVAGRTCNDLWQKTDVHVWLCGAKKHSQDQNVSVRNNFFDHLLKEIQHWNPFIFPSSVEHVESKGSSSMARFADQNVQPISMYQMFPWNTRKASRCLRNKPEKHSIRTILLMLTLYTLHVLYQKN